MVGCGGFIRDLRGSRSCGFAKRIGYANSFLAKLWGVYERLFTRVKGYQLIEDSYVMYEQPPPIIRPLLLVDVNGGFNFPSHSDKRLLLAEPVRVYSPLTQILPSSSTQFGCDECVEHKGREVMNRSKKRMGNGNKCCKRKLKSMFKALSCKVIEW
ncbi:hypothetical protein HKD37_14G040780 [Glycine soja]